MKKILFFVSFLISSALFAEAPLYRPVGAFTYNKEVLLKKKRTAETTSHMTAEGQERIKELKKLGFICVRKNQQVSICQKTETNLETPAFIQKSVDNYLANAKFIFSGTAEAVLSYDGANTEWMVREDVLMGNHKVDLYKIVKTFNGPWFIVFPVSEEQGIANMELVNNEQLGLPLTMESKIDGQTVAFFITATFVK